MELFSFFFRLVIQTFLGLSKHKSIPKCEAVLIFLYARSSVNIWPGADCCGQTLVKCIQRRTHYGNKREVCWTRKRRESLRALFLGNRGQLIKV